LVALFVGLVIIEIEILVSICCIVKCVIFVGLSKLAKISKLRLNVHVTNYSSLRHFYLKRLRKTV